MRWVERIDLDGHRCSLNRRPQHHTRMCLIKARDLSRWTPRHRWDTVISTRALAERALRARGNDQYTPTTSS